MPYNDLPNVTKLLADRERIRAAVKKGRANVVPKSEVTTKLVDLSPSLRSGIGGEDGVGTDKKMVHYIGPAAAEVFTPLEFMTARAAQRYMKTTYDFTPRQMEVLCAAYWLKSARIQFHFKGAEIVELTGMSKRNSYDVMAELVQCKLIEILKEKNRPYEAREYILSNVAELAVLAFMKFRVQYLVEYSRVAR